MNLVLEFTIRAEVREPAMVGPGPYGIRIVGEVAAGTFEGERLRGTMLGGGDWLLVGADGFGRIDARVQLRTHDGAVIYASYGGVLELNDKVRSTLTSTDGTEYGDQYFFTTP